MEREIKNEREERENKREGKREREREERSVLHVPVQNVLSSRDLGSGSN